MSCKYVNVDCFSFRSKQAIKWAMETTKCQFSVGLSHSGTENTLYVFGC